MPKENLRRQLDKLHRELASTSALDAETREMLEAVARDIERALEGQPDTRHPIRESIEAATLRFEAEHPRLARVLSEVADALAKIGI